MRGRAGVAGVFAVGLTAATGFACGTFSSADDATTADGGAGGIDGGGGGIEAGADSSGQKPVVHGFSKAVVESSPNGGTLNLERPIGTEKNDVLLLVVGDVSVTTELSAFSDAFTNRKGFCSNVNKNSLGFATRIDDGTASFALPFGQGETLTAVLVALGGVRRPSDFTLTDSNSTDGGSAAPVSVPTQSGLVIVGFLSDDTRPQGDGRGVGLEEITSVTFNGRGELKLYEGTFPKGKTGTFGPFTPEPPCWGTLTIAFPSPP